MSKDKDNRVIADFIGDINEDNGKILQYDSSWNALMRVVDKIECMFPQYSINIDRNGCNISWGTDDDWIVCRTDEGAKQSMIQKWLTPVTNKVGKLEATYKAIVEFIEWKETEKANKHTVEEDKKIGHFQDELDLVEEGYSFSFSDRKQVDRVECPACSKLSSYYYQDVCHGDKYQCSSCGTKSSIHGNGLMVWDVNPMLKQNMINKYRHHGICELINNIEIHNSSMPPEYHIKSSVVK